MDLSPITKHESKAIPGVSYKIKRMGPRLKAQVELATIPARARIRELNDSIAQIEEKMNPLIEAAPKKTVKNLLTGLDEKVPETITPAMLKLSYERLNLIDEREALSKRDIYPEWVRVGLLSVEGEPLNGNVITAESLADSGPEELFNEILVSTLDSSHLGADEAKNSKSLSTSSTQAGGTATNGNAEPVNEQEPTPNAIAASSSQS